MNESIFVRVQRVVSGGIGSTVEAVERASGTSLMREAIRQVEQAIEDTRAGKQVAWERSLHAARQQDMVAERIATLEEQARFALGKGREDLAEAALSRQLDHEAQMKQLRATQVESEAETKRLDEALATLKLRKSEMIEELAAFEAAKREAAAGAEGAMDLRAERKVARAEAAFERAMGAAGSVGIGPMERAAAAKVAEVDAMLREAAIAQRIAALRDTPAAKKPGGKKGQGG